MKKLLLSIASVALAVSSAIANPKQAIMIDASSVDAIDNFQEYAAAKWFTDENPDGVVIAPGEVSKIDHRNLDCIWIHIDRLNVGKGNLPATFTDAATVDALKQFVADGGCLYLSKHATQLLSKLGVIDAKFDPNIYGDGDGGKGTDVWCLNAQIGFWQLNPDNGAQDPSQYYDHRGHAIYEGLTSGNTFNAPIENFPMEGTADGSEMHREDHNCLWDLNAYQYASEGVNTVKKFEEDNNCSVIGTWGHVQDYAVAGVIEFLPKAERQGRVIANGLAACEWAPRTGVNAYHSNLQKLTSNTLNYLTTMAVSGVESVEAEEVADGPVVYYTLQGQRVANPENGIFIRVQGGNAAKVRF